MSKTETETQAETRADEITVVADSRQPKRSVPLWVAALVGTLVVFVCGALMTILYRQNQTTQDEVARLQTPEGQQELSRQQTELILSKVAALIVLPSEEVPVIATINDAETLKSQEPFYADAQNGDFVIVFAQAGKAIIYRESENKLVNIGGVLIEQQPVSTESTANLSTETTLIPVEAAP